MGLDAVELVMECETEFGISIPDADASKVVTVADLYALILRIRNPDAARPDAASAMAAVAQALTQSGLTPPPLTPSSRLSSLVPFNKRHGFRDTLTKRLGVGLPSLGQAKGGCAISLAWMTLFTLAAGLGGTQWIAFGLVFGILTGGVVFVTLNRAMPTFPPRLQTVQDVIDQSGPQSNAQVWQTLVTIISEQLGVRAEEITLATRFVEDLNVG